MTNLIIDKDEAMLVLDSPINKEEALGIAKEIPENITKVNVQGNLDKLLELLLALDQDKYLVNVEGNEPFNEMFKSNSCVAFFPAWMELAHTYTDHSCTPASVFDLKKSIMDLDMVSYKKYLNEND